MKKLPGEQVEALKVTFKKDKGREKLRYQALWLLARGYKRKQVVEIIGVSIQSLGNWVTQYKKYGLKGLKDKPQSGNHRHLTNNQKKAIKQLITRKTPEKLGYEGRFWDTDKLKRLVRDRFKVSYKTPDGYSRLFKWCGFTYHKPDRVNNRQTVKSKKEFEDRLKKSWRGIAREMGWYW